MQEVHGVHWHCNAVDNVLSFTFHEIPLLDDVLHESGNEAENSN